MGLGERCKLPQWGLGTVGRASAEIEFGAFYPHNMTFVGSNFTNYPESYCDFSMQLTHNFLLTFRLRTIQTENRLEHCRLQCVSNVSTKKKKSFCQKCQKG